MLSPRDKAKIEDIARRYSVERVLLFGSAAGDQVDSRDIDLAVEGLAPARFFSFYAEQRLEPLVANLAGINAAFRRDLQRLGR